MLRPLQFIRIATLLLSFSPILVFAQPQTANDIQTLREELKELRRRTEQIESKLLQLEQSPTPVGKEISQPSPIVEKASNLPTRANDPIIQPKRDQRLFNLSLDGLIAAGGSTAEDLDRLQLGGHDPIQNGFTLQSLEATLDGAVDPYFRAQANIALQLDSHSETSLEVEEAWLESSYLPGNFQLRLGQIMTDFGRINPTHPHSWAFVDSPLVNARFFGPDGLRNPGARLSWLTPTPFYSEIFLSIQNSSGETMQSFGFDHEGQTYLGRSQIERPTSRLSDLLITPRYVFSYDLTPSQTLLAGLSAALGPNASGMDERTEIYGLDLFWKWKPTTHSGGFPFVSWQTEAMVRHYSAASGEIDIAGTPTLLNRERIEDHGAYSQISWGFHKGWVAALRGDYISSAQSAGYEQLLGPDPDLISRWRFSPNLTWFPTEFSKIRLQYNLDHRETIGADHSIWLQFEFLLGAHGAHKF